MKLAKKNFLEIDGYFGEGNFYQIDRQGNVYTWRKKTPIGSHARGFKWSERLDKPKLLKLKVNVKGYVRIGYWENGKYKNKSVHRLVATAFIPNPDNLPFINHKDMNKLNNSVENLEWCDHTHNMRHRSKLSLEDIAAIRGNTTLTQYQLAEKYGVNQPQISRIINKVNWA